MHHYSIKQLSNALHNKEFTSVELTEYFLKRIEKHKYLNAFISVDNHQALEEAKTADKLIVSGKASPLTGIPMAHKDIFCTQKLKTTCASKILAHYSSPYNATIVEKLQNQGAVMVGKTNMDEFAMGSSNENSYFGPVRNPWNQERVPGGSSGGSAAAVSARLIPYATASDTGGSIRQPASFCSLSGLKPTYGLISRYGMVAYASSLEQAGPIASSVEDLAIVLNVIAGFDAKDSTSLQTKIPDYCSHLNLPSSPLRIGLPSCFFKSDVDPSVQHIIKDAIRVFEQNGAEIIELDLELQPLWVPCYYVIACAEASSNLSRYDGIRFGYRSSNVQNIKSLVRRSRAEGFGNEVKRRILTGTHILSAGYFDAYFIQALKIRRLIQNELSEALNHVDVICGPTSPFPPFSIGKQTTPVQRYLADEFTVAANLSGFPALSIPAGFTKGLPVGLQIMGAPFNETKLLQTGHQFQQITDWHQVSPLD